MRKIICIIILIFLIFQDKSAAQTCTALGQNPSTAFPVCGTADFVQTSVPVCGGRSVPSQCPGNLFTDINPYWYRFTCYTSGTLGFVIKPVVNADDYDWQIFDITGKDPNAVYTDPSIFIACNWSADDGPTGASSAGTSLVRCEGPGVPLFSRMPDLTVGHTYLMLVSHFDGNSQSGYTLSFGGGTAVITDPLEPHLKSATASCDGKLIKVKLNKKMKCATLAADGSDFTINAAGNSIIAATGAGCSSSFDMDSLVLQLTNPLAAGNYTITIKNGSDVNTLKDNCDRSIPVNENIPLTVLPITPTPMDSLTKPLCAPSVLELVFRKPMLCNSIATNGSDFIVNGPVPVTVVSASGTCTNGVSNSIKVQLSAPLQVGGTYTIRLQNGTDGNTLLDECSQQTPVGSSISFAIKDTVNADFTFNTIFGCDQNSVQYNHPGGNAVNTWKWTFDNTSTSTLQNPLIVYKNFQPKKTQLVVSNGVCSDTASVDIVFDNLLVAKFEGTNLVCPEDFAKFADKSEGKITTWNWSFGNGITSSQQNPPDQKYPVTASTRNEMVQLIISNSYGCSDTAKQLIKVINNCYIAVPSAFTPNGDGLNDFLYPLNAYKAKDLSFSVYNRFGQRLFFTRDWNIKWDGSFKGQGADAGTYVWVLSYVNIDTGLKVEQKGTTILIR